MNQVVAHTRAGQLIKGVTNDFFPNKDRFHLVPAGSSPGTKPLEILLADLKGLFFVKDFAGKPGHVKKNTFDQRQVFQGKKLRVVFHDGEILFGTTQGYQPGRPAFFMIPADPESNNERCFIITAATKEITVLP
jgi:hypothetical protein